MLLFAERIQIDEYRITFHLARIFDAQMVRIGEHGHNFLLYFLLGIG